MTKAEINILKKALFIAGCEEFEAYKALPDEKAIFSEVFEKNIQKLAKKRKSLAWQATKTVPRRIAVVFIAAIITFCLMMSISAIRTPVINFFVDIYETFISIFVEEEQEDFNMPTSIESVCLPSYMIDGYIQIDSQNYGNNAKTFWMNDSSVIMLQQEILEEELKTFINNENVKYQKISVSEYEIYYYIDKGTYFIIWSVNGYLFTMICPEDISLKDINEMISSIK